jgi:ABC-2 type transport system ATP-binding protein
MSTSVLLQAESLSKRYADQLAVRELSFHINKGEIVGFLGPNGAGKSTTMKMLSGNLAPDTGSIRINGYDLLTQPQQAKADIGYLPETPPVYKELTVTEYLAFCARLNQIPKSMRPSAIDNTLARCGLTEVSHRLIGHLSKGFQQRVGIAQAIIHAPAVVILDEPTSGLDPIQIREIRQLIRDVAQEHSVILSTHILPEVQMLCDRVQIISHGQLLFNDVITALDEQRTATTLMVEFEHTISLEALADLPGITDIEPISDTQFRLHIDTIHHPTSALLARCVQAALPLKSLMPEKHSLEDVFMQIIQSEQPHA